MTREEHDEAFRQFAGAMGMAAEIERLRRDLATAVEALKWYEELTFLGGKAADTLAQIKGGE